MELLIIALVIAGFLLYYYIVLKDKWESIEKREAFLQSALNINRDLLSEIVKSYDVHPCSRCDENEMEMVKVSPTCKSVQYRCAFCSKKRTAKLLNNADPDRMKDLYHKLRYVLGEQLVPFITDSFLEREIDNTFFVEHKHVPNNKNEQITREPIPEKVRREVWRRDRGRCVKCGSLEKLEFDHIIPVSKGGANTARNLQLLCESCNRSKGAKI